MKYRFEQDANGVFIFPGIQHLLEDRFQYVMEDVMVVFGSRVSLEADVVPLVDVVRQRVLLAKLGGLEI